MTEYLCQVADATGKRTSLRRTTSSEAVLIRDLGNEGHLILKIEETRPDSSRAEKRLSSKNVLKFTEILETLTGNGLSLKEALTLARPLGGKELGSFLANLDAKVQKGVSLHQALVEGPRGFSPLYLGLVRIGEQTGDLATIYPRLVEYLRARRALREKTVNAMVYPVFVLTVALVGIALLSTLVLPVLTESISSVNPEVALQYRQNVAQFQFTATALFVVLALVSLGFVGLHFASRRSTSLALQVDRLVLKTPGLSTIVWQGFCLNISFALEILLSSGFSLENALGECDALISNRALRASWARVRDRVVKGSSLSRALRQDSGYPAVFLGWIEVGESAHDLRRSCQHLRSFYQNQVDTMTTRIANLAEPGLIVLVGALVIMLVLTFVTPIFTMLGRII